MTQVWSIDFMNDQLADGRRFRPLNISGDFIREALRIEGDISLPSERVICVLNRIIARRGRASIIRCDNGPGNSSMAILDWGNGAGIHLDHIGGQAATERVC